MEEELGKVGVYLFLLYHFNVLTIVPKSWTSLCEFIHFISRVHVLHYASSSTSLSWHIRLRWLKESNAVAEGDECDGWRSRMQWPKETNAIAEGVECDSWRSRMRWLEESNAVTGGDECCDRRRRMLWLEETEHEPLNRFYTIPHRDNTLKIIVFHLFALRFSLYSTMLSGLSEIPTNHFFF